MMETVENKIEPIAPFVNEECGDTMWDEVLAQDDAKTNTKSKVEMRVSRKSSLKAKTSV